MTKTAEIINHLLALKPSCEARERERFRGWFLQQFRTENYLRNSSLEEFSVYFLNAVHLIVEQHLRTNENGTPRKCTTPLRLPKVIVANNSTPKLAPVPQCESSPVPSTTPIKTSITNLDKEGESLLERLSQNKNRSILLEQGECDEHNLSSSLDSLSNASTPLRQVPSYPLLNSHNQNRRPNKSFNCDACSTPKSSEKAPRCSGAVGGSTSICLGDFMIHSRTSNKKSSSNSGKPRKRVVPTKISTSSSANNTPFVNHSTFSNENNILKISTTEIDDKNKCSILKARMTLKQNAKEISREWESSIKDSKQINVSNAVSRSEQTTDINHDKLLSAIKMQNTEQLATVERIAAVYSILMDMNYVTNVLSEISFLVNVLNAVETEDGGAADGEKCESLSRNSLDLLHNKINCIYFTLCVLNSQRTVLGLLDLKSLGVVLCCERLMTLSEDLKEFLNNIYHSKQNQLQQFRSTDDDFSTTAACDKSFSNVYFQEDSDSRHNFPSNSEFGAFKSQRDVFYNALKLWESKHLHVAWSFQQEITPKIREIFRFSEHPVNMAHLAELFVSQLLISSNYTASPEEIGVDVDLQKFSKLTQRLVTPSNFSVDYKFPNNQAFFRNFIQEAHSIAFLEQLKLALYSKLIALNESTIELLDMPKHEDEDCNKGCRRNEFIVRPKVLSSLLVLAKFSGYVTVFPFYYYSCTPFEHFSCLDKPKTDLRSLLQSNLNLEKLLKAAIENRKLIITLPWLVQYLAMLDNVTLQMNNYVAVTQLMFCIYIKIDRGKSTLASTPLFIIRCCLGWLFDTKAIIAEQYYNFRMTAFHEKHKDLEWLETMSLFNSSSRCTAENQVALSPILEPLLIVACPFLAEFRVSIMPAKCAMVKCVSRSGRYRHITTRMPELRSSSDSEDVSCAVNPEARRKLAENKLIEAFLHSQNSSARRLIEFIIERIYKSTIKDAQFKILVPSKNAAEAQINDITSRHYADVSKAVQAIHQSAFLAATKEWDATVPDIIKERISSALEALLPTATEPIVKSTYFDLIRRNTLAKINQWKQTNFFSTNYYCSNVEELMQKICKLHPRAHHRPTTSTELAIVKLEPCLSNCLDELQYWLHWTSVRPERMPEASRLMEFLRQLPLVFENTLPTALYGMLGAGTVQIMQNIIAMDPTLLTTELIDAFKSLWSSVDMQKYAIKINSKHNNERNDDEEMSDCGSMISFTTPGIFYGLVTIPFIELIGSNKSCFDKLKEVLLVLIKSNLITIDFVNVLFVPIFKHEWHSSVFNVISTMLQGIADDSNGCEGGEGLNVCSNYDDMKSNLLMEVLADFARDVDNF